MRAAKIGVAALLLIIIPRVCPALPPAFPHPTMLAARRTAPSAPASTTRVGSQDWSIWMAAPL